MNFKATVRVSRKPLSARIASPGSIAPDVMSHRPPPQQAPSPSYRKKRATRGMLGLTIHSSRRRFAARLNSGVRAAMKRFVAIFAVMTLSAGCDGPYYAHTPTPIDISIGNSQYQLDAFGGTLYGENLGEWVGGLYFRDQADRAYEVIDQNVHGIIRNSSGIFVFTGLAHLGLNDGYIYQLTVDKEQHLKPARLGRLPGAPSQVIQHQNGVTSFLTFAGFLGDSEHYKCFALDGTNVSESNLCTSPSRRQP